MEVELSDALLPCPACDKELTRNLGPLRKIAGAISLPDPGNLYACDSCGLLFRHPYMSESCVQRSYKGFFSEKWADTKQRPDFHLAAEAIQSSYSSGKVLDIGCFTGDFLKLLPSTFSKYGIEPSRYASDIARQHGIEIVGASVDDIKTHCSPFHAITLLDVFEHLPRPMDTLKKVIDLLQPGGIIIVVTGNTDAFLWRMMRRDYYYYFPEHVSFANPGWFRWAARHLHLRVDMVKRVAHRKASFFKKWRQFIHCVAYLGLGRLSAHSRPYQMLCTVYPFNRIQKWTSAPLASFLSDHMMVVLKSRSGHPTQNT